LDIPYEGEGRVHPFLCFLPERLESGSSAWLSDLNNEVGGILVGKWCADSETTRQFIVITAALPAGLPSKVVFS